MDKNACVPVGLRARTLDFYVAFLVFFIGFSSFIDPTWPERLEAPMYWVVIIEDIYLMAASAVIIGSLIMREFIRNCNMKFIIPSLLGEMFGWLFVSAAAWVIVLTSWWVPPSSLVNTDNSVYFWSWIIVCIGLGAASFMRYLDLRLHYRSRTK